jgi:Cof subfamily protein (haloacid dehalogenase superfamily)
MSGGAVQIRLVIADVDGTLVNSQKVLTERSVEAVRSLHEAGIAFAVTSGRPPRGMQMLIEPLALETPISAFNGGLIVQPDMSVIEQRTIPDELAPAIVSHLDRAGLDAWLYRGSEWYVRDADAPHVAREAATVQFEPTVAASFEGLENELAKVVGVSDDHALVEATAEGARREFGSRVSASRSQPYYLDITHPRANKGEVALFLSARLGVPAEQIATIGDMPNDVLMFAHSGLSIAMGQSDREVQRAARCVTSANDDEGFAEAMERFVLAGAGAEAKAPAAQSGERS